MTMSIWNEKCILSPSLICLDMCNLENQMRVLEQCGVAPEKVTAFGEKYDERFGAAAEFSPHTVVDTGAIAVETPDVSIRVSPDRSDLIETRIIDGKRYILIRAESSVEVNGVSVNIK